MGRLTRPFWILLALVFLFEAWLWNHLVPIVAWLVDHIAWAKLKRRIAAWIKPLPPYPTLLVFLVPILLLLPLKFLGVWMLAHGSWLGAVATLALAKVASMGVTAFIFDVTRPKLLQLPWFRWLYAHMLDWIARAHAVVDPVKAEIRAYARRELGPIRRRLKRLRWLLQPRRAGRFARRLARIRRRAQVIASRA